MSALRLTYTHSREVFIMFELDLHRLAVFYTVVNEGTLSKAGDSLYMSQPAISAHIKALEQQLGISLFYRVGRRSVVNKAGEVLYRKAEQLFSVADELKAEMDDMRGMSIGRLNLGASVDWQYSLPGYLDRFKQAHPGVEISMNVYPTERVERMVLDRTLDLGFIGGKTSKFDLASEHLIDDEIVPICSKGHRLAKRISSDVIKLDEESFIVREPESESRRIANGMLEANGLVENVLMELGSDEAIKWAVMAGRAIGLVARQSVDVELQAGLLRVLEIDSLTAPVEMHLIYIKERKMSAIQTAFVDMLSTSAALVA